MKKVLAFILFCTFLFSSVNIFAEENVDTIEVQEEETPSEIAEEDPPEDITYYIPWEFIAYETPDFMARQICNYSPRTISVLKDNGEGWALIDTYYGEGWVNYKKNARYINKYMGLFDQKVGNVLLAVIEPQIVTIVDKDGIWLKIKTWMGDKWIDSTKDFFKPKAKIDVPIFDQRKLGYPTGCEIISVAMMINYEKKIAVKTIVSEMPRSNDPYKGFRGEPSAKGGFTVFPSALLSLTEKYMGSATDMTGCTTDELKKQLSRDIPVVVWVNGLGFNVHAVCLSGYDEKGFYYNDPWTGEKDAFIKYTDFYEIWNKPIYDSQTKVSYSARKALSY
ncbi:hypothetical protein FACS189490_04980 [Clostridia bacterium]|nr:hypothetical protein FACS189490_04980 [Clostridia bacterium]